MVQELYVGLMTGTSFDGVDVALVRFNDNRLPECVATYFKPYECAIRTELLQLQCPDYHELHRASLLANRLAEINAEAIVSLLDRSAVGSNEIRAIGCHGQTVRHAPDHGYTIQINSPALLVELTGIAVVADFRSRDIAAGGQGAPLVPAFHDFLFRQVDRHRVIVNIGGIANITDLAPDRGTRGFDTGPGNVLLDGWTQKQLALPYDNGGAWSKLGKAIPKLLDRLCTHCYFSQTPPKSCGREQFNMDWLTTQLAGDESSVDVQATLISFTAITIANAIRRYCGKPDELYVCGGGAHNAVLMTAIAEQLPGCHTDTTEALGLPPDWVEAVAFAWLARQSVLGKTGNLPEVTGARGPRVLGALYPK